MFLRNISPNIRSYLPRSAAVFAAVSLGTTLSSNAYTHQPSQHKKPFPFINHMTAYAADIPSPPTLSNNPTPSSPTPLSLSTGMQDTSLGHKRASARQTLQEVIDKNPLPNSSAGALSDDEFKQINSENLEQQANVFKEVQERLETEYIVNTLARRDGLSAGSQTVQLSKDDIERMQKYQSPLVAGNKTVHAYESSFISPVPHMIYEPAPAGEFFIWPPEIETLALYLVQEAGYELLRKPWHPNRFISGRNHLLGREEFELYGRTLPGHPTRPKSLPHLPFVDDRLRQHPAIPQEKHVSTVFGIAHCGPFTEALVQDYVDEGMLMSLLNRVSHSALLVNNVTGRPESTAYHFKRMPNPGEPIFISATLEYSANKDKALVCAALFDADLDASYLDTKTVFKIMRSTDFSQKELEFIDKQTLPSLRRIKQELKQEDSSQVSTAVNGKPSDGLLSGLINRVTAK